MLYFVAPDPVSFISGGNRFNQQIIQGLLQLHLPVHRIEFDDVHPVLESMNNIVVIDSIYFDRLDTFLIERAKAKTVFLIHLLPSMLNGNTGHEPDLLNCFDLIVANSSFTYDYCRLSLGLKKEVIIVEPFTVRPFITGQRKKNNIVCVANWSPGKQIDRFLSTLALNNLSGDIMIHFYGDYIRDEAYFKCCTGILETHPDLQKHIRVHGKTDHDKLNSVYSEASLFIDTSAMETYGMAVAESIVYGVPVISLGNGNIPGILGSVNGYIARDMDDLFNHMIQYDSGELVFDKMDSSHLMTDWKAFLHQLRHIKALQ